ncbi:CHAT domain-containing protein [Limnospira fusiformis KN01]|nr:MULTISPECIES: CHAT domain-containing protein [Limnospira]MDY7055006.1 CHAT domain-containing protein [Limnospira fusiformis LS22]MDT9189507.1 CHAT domain-containing protein [Limnospira sp. PMC 894.15]MDT9199796.1 CHAT domain-containing protein [Limnospira sp. PMC 1042.18]MDT9276182.1 CHAT domain-containing protein [Limnospira sp. PMC 737.11]ULB44870.1 CHAT domain-containing protein [Limnospira fusiformis KN01]
MNPVHHLQLVLIPVSCASLMVLDILSIIPQNFFDIRYNRAIAQPIVPEPNSTNTITHQQGNQTNITGGQLSGNGSNLFHSFTHFNVESGAVANFIATPEIQNILTRVVGGDASRINGLLQVTGGASNLFLINPAGILFGAGARLDVPGSFTATTASGIGFGDRWMSAIGANDYSTLVGTPNAFAFGTNPGSIVNAGELAVTQGEQITLLGGTVINTGSLVAPGGEITMAAVEGENILRISQAGHLLSLEVSPAASPDGLSTNLTPLSLPELLTGGDENYATGVNILADGRIQLTGSNTPITPNPGVVAVSGTIDTDSTIFNHSPQINIFGDRIGIWGANISASAPDNGGTIRIGGDYLGQGTVPNAIYTLIDDNSTLAANATTNGDGGRIIIWSDGHTQFSGNISAQGQHQGGFVEISGLETLSVDGSVNLRGGDGNLGTLLLDPLNIRIVDSEASPNNNIDFDGVVTADQGPAEYTLSQTTLENLAADADITLEARNDIRIDQLSNQKLDLRTTTGTVTFRADANGDGQGSFIMHSGDTILTRGGNLNIFGVNIATGNIRTSGGDVNLTASGIGQINTGVISTANSDNTGGDITLRSSQGSITTNNLKTDGRFSGGNITINSGRQIFTGPLSSQATDTTGVGGNIQLEASREIFLEGINTSGFRGGGDVSIISEGSRIIMDDTNNRTRPSRIITSSVRGEGGDVLITTSESMDLGAIDSRGRQSGGNITLDAGIEISVGAISTGVWDGLLSPDTTGGNIMLTGDTINLNGGLSGSGSLLLQPASPTQDIRLGRNSGLSANSSPTGDPLSLNFNSLELSQITRGFSEIIIGRSDSQGTIYIEGDLRFQDPVMMRSPQGRIIATGDESLPTIRGVGNSSLTLEAENEIILGNLVTEGGDISVISQSDIIQIEGIHTLPNGSNQGNILLRGSEINLVGGSHSVRGSGSLRLESSHSGQIMTLGSEENTTGLDIKLSDIDAFAPGFERIIIGSPDGNSIIEIAQDITFTSPVLLQSSSDLGQIIAEGNITGIGDASISLQADGDIRIRDINSSGLNIYINSARGEVITGNLQSGGNINIRSQGNIQTGELRSNASLDNLAFRTIDLSSQRGQITVDGNILGDATFLSLVGRDDIQTGNITAGRGMSLNSDRGTITTGNLQIASPDSLDSSINITALGNINTGDISTATDSGTGANITITSRQGGVQSRNLNTSGSTAGGSIVVQAQDQIFLGAINTNSSEGNAGSVRLTSENDIEVSLINTEAQLRGGSLIIDTSRFFRVTDTFEAMNDVEASISTIGSTGSGTIRLPAFSTPLVIGDPSQNGTAGAITDGQLTAGADTTIVGNNFEQNSIRQTTVNQPEITTENQDLSDVETTGSSVSSIPENLSNSNSNTSDSDQNISGNSNHDAESPLINSNTEANPDIDQAGNLVVQVEPTTVPTDQMARSPLVSSVLQIDSFRGREFLNYFGYNLSKNTVDDQSIRQTLSDIVRITNYKPAIIYVSIQPEILELRLLLPNGEAVFKSVAVNREELLQVARQFSHQIRTPQNFQDTQYKESGQQLYNWLIEPIKQELEKHGIDILIFSMDAGLRTLPLAALYDGEQFLIENYSLSLIPSLSLTDTSYVNLQNARVLAMGASKFPNSNLDPLPAVPLELDLIVGNIWPGQAFLNEEFTIANLKSQREQGEYKIVHLATHGEFVSGGADRSYIQFWDQKLWLNQLRELRLNQPPVELLVLSACTTAVGDEKAELGFAGLAVQAGVKSAMASLWYVSDAGTLGLMTTFYNALTATPIKAEALRQSQLAMLNGQVRLENGYLLSQTNMNTRRGDISTPVPQELAKQNPVDLSHPFYWAGFTLIGSPW